MLPVRELTLGRLNNQFKPLLKLLRLRMNCVVRWLILKCKRYQWLR